MYTDIQVLTVISQYQFEQTKMNSQQKAQLQTLGIDLYESIASIDVAKMPWLNDVCVLLNIGIEDCVFDSPQPYFDNEANQLHLPQAFYNSELCLKKTIWQNIQQWTKN